jgi:hypothetical protein
MTLDIINNSKCDPSNKDNFFKKKKLRNDLNYKNTHTKKKKVKEVDHKTKFFFI